MTFVRALTLCLAAFAIGCAPVVGPSGQHSGDMAVDPGGGGSAGSGGGTDDMGGTGGNGSSCPTGCTIGATSCDGNGVRTCADDGHGCGVWGNAVACTGSQVCSGGTCAAACSSQCMLGATYCS